MRLFKNFKPNVESVLLSLIKQLKVQVTAQTIHQCLQNHPQYPSLLSISDCLNGWNIPNQAYKISKNDYDAEDLLFPFLAHFGEKGGRFVLVHEIRNQTVVFSDEQYNRSNLSEDEFLKRWDGIALHAEKGLESGEKGYFENHIKSVLQQMLMPVTLGLLLASFGLALFHNTPALPDALLGITKLAGVIFGVLLLMQSINSSNPFIQNLCGLGGKNDCNAILKSDAAKLTNWLSWSEVGFFYFSGSLLLLLINPGAAGILAWLNVLALPYTLYSITYQYRSKNWCILCCSVQVILWLEFVINVFAQQYTFSFSNAVLYQLPIAFLLPIVLWSFLKPFFINSSQLKPLQGQLKKFKYNTGLFNQALTNQPRYAISDELMPIVLGNPKAETVITMVSNPFCGPCGKAHETIEEWFKGEDDLQLKIVFTTANHDGDERTKVARHISALGQLSDKSHTQNALNDWYKQEHKNYETWAIKYPVAFNGEMSAVTEKQKAWCEMAEITFTPTILINGYKLPEPYRLEDLKYLVNN